MLAGAQNYIERPSFPRKNPVLVKLLMSSPLRLGKCIGQEQSLLYI